MSSRLSLISSHTTLDSICGFLASRLSIFASAHCVLLGKILGVAVLQNPFYTNDSDRDSINAFFKQSHGYKKHQWNIFNSKVEPLQQQRVVEKTEQ